MLVPVDGGEFQVNDSHSARSCKKPNSYKSDPKGAEVYVNGRYMGHTPCRLKLESRESYVIEFVKQGYDTKSVNVTNHVAVGWIVLDVLAGLVPVVVDAATGS